MRSVGIREPKEHASSILRRVRDQGESVEVMYRSEVTARIVPMRKSKPAEDELAVTWASLDQLAAEIGRSWPEGVSAADAVRDLRREL